MFFIVTNMVIPKENDKILLDTKTRIVAIVHALTVFFYAIDDLYSNGIDLDA